MRKTYFLAALYILCSTHIFSQTPTVGLFTHVAGSYDSGYVLFPPYVNCDTTYLINRCGKLVHKWPSAYTPGADAFLLPDGSLLRAGHIANPTFDPCGCGIGGIIERIDWSGNVAWHYIISNSLQSQNHDICPLPNGNILVDVWESIDYPTAVNYGRNPLYINKTLYVPKVMEIKPLGTDSAEIVWTWRLLDHMIQDYDPILPNYGVVKDHPELVDFNYINTAAEPPNGTDWTHFNSIAYNSDLDQVMLCFRNFNEIYIIDHSIDSATAAGHVGGKYKKGGDLLYRWGNPAVYGRDTTSSEQKLYLPHNPEWISYGKYKGQIIIFNNGVGRPGGSGSSIDIINPPVDTSGSYSLPTGGIYEPSSLSFTYPPTITSSFLSATMGSAQVLPNGHIFINDAIAGKFFEIDSSNNIVWQYVNPVSNGVPIEQYTLPTSNSVYRAIVYPTNYPAFTTHAIEPGDPIELNPIHIDCDSTIIIVSGVPQLMPQLISIYPNPSTHTITVQSNSTSAIQKIWITDMAGKLLLTAEHVATQQQIDISMLADGIYLLKAEDVNGMVSQTKLIKQ